MYPRDDGIGLSLLIYLAAMLCGVAAIVLPVYFATRPMVIKNANVQTFERHEDRAAFSRYHFLHLKERTIVTPTELAQVDAQEKEAEDRHPVRLARRARGHRRPPPHNAYAEVEAPRRPAYRSIWALF